MDLARVTSLAPLEDILQYEFVDKSLLYHAATPKTKTKDSPDLQK
jgi:hypothetical protein